LETFPPRLPEQPIFYPVLNEEYAAWISRNWNVREYGSDSVTRFAVRSEFARRYPIQRVGAGHAEELWVPAEELAGFNRNIVGRIEVVAEFHGESLFHSPRVIRGDLIEYRPSNDDGTLSGGDRDRARLLERPESIEMGSGSGAGPHKR
jgi:hypothetical protein